MGTIRKESSVQYAKRSGRPLCGVGLGLRWEFLEQLVACRKLPLSFVEFTPENYLERGGATIEGLREVCKILPVVSHGTSLSLGAADDPDPQTVEKIGSLLRETGALWHSDHLSFCSNGSESLHELFSVPWTASNVRRIAARLENVQEQLGVPLCIEPISWYSQWAKNEMTEAQFISGILERSDCGLILDVNNVFINATNHGFDPRAFIQQLPLDRVVELHVAGHQQHPSGMLVDTHGASVCFEVKELLGDTLRRVGPVPVLLERDTEIPELEVLLSEVVELTKVYDAAFASQGTSSPLQAFHDG